MEEWGALLTPSFGFVLGFIAMAYITGYLYERGVNLWLSCLVGSIILYLVGIPYMAFILNTYLGNSFNLLKILNLGLIPFLPGDSLKIVGAGMSIVGIKRHINLPI